MTDATSAVPLLDETARLRAGSGASWGAILAGAIVAVSLSLLLLTLGTGLGFASISPWPDRGLTATGFTVAGAIWIIVTQWLSAAIGGYIAGRLRQRWLATHTHEVFFRDTAHGLVTWSVATLVVATVLAGSITSLVGGGAKAVGSLAAAGGIAAATTEVHPQGGMTPGAGAGDHSVVAYDLDKLFRSGVPVTLPRGGDGPRSAEGELRGDGGELRGDGAHAQAMHIAVNALASGALDDEDRTYLANLVAADTGISTDEAQKRVDSFIERVKEAAEKAKAEADEARKATATAALYTALSLLIGAFIASVSAAIGGRLRDEHL
jgi:hypothetical protein